MDPTPQLHINTDEPDPRMMQPVTMGSTQPEGGLWTGPLDEDSHWCDIFMHVQGKPRMNPRWYRTEGKDFYVWKMHPAHAARIAVIDGLPDLVRLGERYGFEHSYLCNFGRIGPAMTLRFTRMAEEWDAIRVTEKAVQELERPEAGKYRLFAWHAESTCWFRWCFARVELLKPLTEYVKSLNDPYRSMRILRRVTRCAF